MVQGVLHLKQHRGGPGNDAVEILRIAERLHHRLAAAIGTAVEIAEGRGLAVKLPDQRLGGQSGDVLSAVGEIGAKARIQSPVGPKARMAHIGRRHHKAAVVEHLPHSPPQPTCR